MSSVETEAPYELDDLGFPRRVLAWLRPEADKSSVGIVARNTIIGLVAHIRDDAATQTLSIPEMVDTLRDLIGAGYVAENADGTYSRTPAGDAILGGVVYADEVAAGRLVAQSDGSYVEPVTGI